MEKKHWSFVGRVALGSTVVNPALAPVATSAAMIAAVRFAAWEQSIASTFDSGQKSLSQVLDEGIRKMGAKRYVPDGVMLVCSSGTKPAKLLVKSQSTVKIASGRLVATLPDKMDCNMMCAQLIVGGAIAGAIIAAVAVAAIALSGGTVLIAGSAILGAAAIGAGGAVVGAGVGAVLAGFIPCLCAMLTGPWIPVHPRMIVCGQPALIEDSKMTCFLGGMVSIFYSPEVAKKMASVNRNCMWWDLAGVVLNSAIMSAAMAGVGGLLKNTVGLAKYSKELSQVVGLQNVALKYFGVNILTAGGVLGMSRIVVDPFKTNIYKSIPMGESTYQDYVNGDVVSKKIEEKNSNTDYNTDNFKEAAERTDWIPQDDPGEGSQTMSSLLSVKGGRLSVVRQGINSFGWGLGINVGVGIVDDFFEAKKSQVLIKAYEEADSLDHMEFTAKAGIKVCENDI